MKTLHLRGRWTLAKFEHLVKALKLILFDIALLIVFVIALIRFIRVELGW